MKKQTSRNDADGEINSEEGWNTKDRSYEEDGLGFTLWLGPDHLYPIWNWMDPKWIKKLTKHLLDSCFITLSLCLRWRE